MSVFSKKMNYTLHFLKYITPNSDEIYQTNNLSHLLDILYRYLRKILTSVIKRRFINKYLEEAVVPDWYKYQVDIVSETRIEQRFFLSYYKSSLNNPCIVFNK